MATQLKTGVADTPTHAGVNNFAWRMNGEDTWYVIPQDGYGRVTQATKVQLYANEEIEFSFEYDDAAVITFHGGQTGFQARNID